ncbi:hypothetical protein V492_02211 [Pseudogymnoascus sp. VKM F-4246]|nr:hypothetical protein V492_02211 [Pseudogymnoascus sp. VKM F-4246]
MDNSNGTGCSPYSSSSAVGGYDCFGTTGPYGTGYHNISSGRFKAPNQTGQKVMDAMIKCCPSDVEAWKDDGAGKTCYSSCKTSGIDEAAKANKCFELYKSQYPDYFFGTLGCNLGDETENADKPGSAPMLGRTGGWGGLVVLGLVISTAATMF